MSRPPAQTQSLPAELQSPTVENFLSTVLLGMCLKVTESFLETKIRIKRCERRKVYPVLAKIRINQRFFVKKTSKIICSGRFFRFGENPDQPNPD